MFKHLFHSQYQLFDRLMKQVKGTMYGPNGLRAAPRRALKKDQLYFLS